MEENMYTTDSDFMINQIDEKLTTVDTFSQSIAFMVASYFAIHIPDEKKKAQIVQAVNNCQERAKRSLNAEFDRYFRKQLLDLVDDEQARAKMQATIDEVAPNEL